MSRAPPGRILSNRPMQKPKLKDIDLWVFEVGLATYLHVTQMTT